MILAIHMGTDVLKGEWTAPTLDVGHARNVTHLIEPLRAKHQVPAVACAVICSNRLVGIGWSGLRRWNRTNQPVGLEDPWHHGSLTKSMTATLAAMLVQEGRLRWDSTLGGTFPDLAPAMEPPWRNVTLEQLCSNRSGAPTELNEGNIWQSLWTFQGTPRSARRKLLELLTAQSPHHPPGTTYEYSNAGFSLAGAMLEETLNQPFEDLLTQRLFRPLGMTTGGFGAPVPTEDTEVPWGHHRVAGRLEGIPPGPHADNPAAIAPAGRVHCSLLDLARYAHFHLKGEWDGTPWLGKDAFIKLHTAVGGQSYAFGWNVAQRSWANGQALNHTGSNTSWFSNLWMAPRRQFAIVAVTNVGDGDGRSDAFLVTDEMAARMIKEFLPPTSSTPDR